MPLSVISALTRLGLEPWEEAARLAALPKALAAEALTPMIARLSLAWQQRSDNLAIAQRLVGFLPVRGHVAELGRQRTGAWDKISLNRDLRLDDKLGGHAKPGSSSLDSMTALPIGGKGDKNESTVRTKLSTITGFAI
jgi:hypothetical protein